MDNLRDSEGSFKGRDGGGAAYHPPPIPAYLITTATQLASIPVDLVSAMGGTAALHCMAVGPTTPLGKDTSILRQARKEWPETVGRAGLSCLGVWNAGFLGFPY